MKIVLMLLISNICFAGDFYYLKNQVGWAGPYEAEQLPTSVAFDCKALMDTATKLPFDKRLMKTKVGGLDCDSKGFAKMKVGQELTDATAIISAEKAADIAKSKALKDIEFGKTVKAELKVLEAQMTTVQMDAFYVSSDIQLIQRYLDSGNITRAKALLLATDMNPFGITSANMATIIGKMETYLGGVK